MSVRYKFRIRKITFTNQKKDFRIEKRQCYMHKSYKLHIKILGIIFAPIVYPLWLLMEDDGWEHVKIYDTLKDAMEGMVHTRESELYDYQKSNIAKEETIDLWN